MSLLQDVLRPTHPRDVDTISSRLNKLTVPDESPAGSRSASPTPRAGGGAGSDSSDEDELIGVVRLLSLSLVFHPFSRSYSARLYRSYDPSFDDSLPTQRARSRAHENVPLSSPLFSVVLRMTPHVST